jgi:hypothetical protein
MHLAHQYAPHEHFGPKGRENADASRLRRVWLFVIAIALHNFPEGLAVGVAAGSGDLADGLGVTLGIGLQNMPETAKPRLPTPDSASSSAGSSSEKKVAASMTPAAKASITFCVVSRSVPSTKTGRAPSEVSTSPARMLAETPVAKGWADAKAASCSMIQM